MSDDIRTGRTQSVKLTKDFYVQDLHKSMFINDLFVLIPAYYVRTWGREILCQHTRGQKWTDVQVEYHPPRQAEDGKKKRFCCSLRYLRSERTQAASYRLKWGKDLAIQFARDYPKSFVRAIEFHIGDEEYNEKGYCEFDIGGFKEQVQLKISWKKGSPKLTIKELFQVREDAQFFPNVYRQLSGYLISDHLLGDDEERARRIHATGWKERIHLKDEMKENILYILANRSRGEVYFGQTKEALSKRYPKNREHHNFDEWQEYCSLHLPEGVTDFQRILIERCLIEAGAQLFENELGVAKSIFGDSAIKLMNKKR